jgi:hypothetical protein
MLPSPYSDYYLVSEGHRKDREGGEATSTPPETPSKSRPGRESLGPPRGLLRRDLGAPAAGPRSVREPRPLSYPNVQELFFRELRPTERRKPPEEYFGEHPF